MASGSRAGRARDRGGHGPVFRLAERIREAGAPSSLSRPGRFWRAMRRGRRPRRSARLVIGTLLAVPADRAGRQRPRSAGLARGDRLRDARDPGRDLDALRVADRGAADPRATAWRRVTLTAQAAGRDEWTRATWGFSTSGTRTIFALQVSVRAPALIGVGFAAVAAGPRRARRVAGRRGGCVRRPWPPLPRSGRWPSSAMAPGRAWWWCPRRARCPALRRVRAGLRGGEGGIGPYWP